MEDFGGEEKAFVVDEVNAVIKECIESTIQNSGYHHNKVGQWNTNIVEQVLKKLTGLNKPFKYISTCTIMQKNGAGLHVASSCFWDNSSDGTATYKYDSKTMYVVVNRFKPSERPDHTSLAGVARAVNVSKVESTAVTKEIAVIKIGIDAAISANELFKLMRKDFKHSPKAFRILPDYDIKHPFIQACKSGDCQQITRLLCDEDIDPGVYQNAGILIALMEGHLRVVHMLLKEKRIQLNDHANLLFRLACELGYLRVVKTLLQKETVDPSACENEGLRYALSKFHITVAECLLNDSRVDPAAGGNMAIAYFSSLGRTNVVKKLLKDPRVDPADNENLAILHATRKVSLKTIEALLKDPRVNPSNAIKLAKAMKHDGMIALFDLYTQCKLDGTEFLPLKDNNTFSNQKNQTTNLSTTVNRKVEGHITIEKQNSIVKKNRELLDAISERDSEKADGILNNSFLDPSADENSALRLACANGLLEVVQKLLRNPKVDPSAANNEALKVACFFGHVHVIGELLKDKRVDASAWNNLAIRYCAFHGEQELLEKLLADPKVDPSDVGNDAIISASNRRRFSIVCRLLKDPRVDPSASNGIVLIDACRYGTLDYLNELLEDPRINHSVDYEKALIWAIRRGDFEIVDRVLKDSRFVPSPKAIGTAFKDDREKIVELIFQNPKFDPTFDGNFPLIFACGAGYLEGCKILLNDSRVDPTVWDNLPIRVAAISGRFEIVELLLKDERVDPFIQGNIVQHIATLFKKQNILELLDKHPKNTGYVTTQTIKFVEDFNYTKPKLIRDDMTAYFTPAPLPMEDLIDDWIDNIDSDNFDVSD